ncbi:hypothetical protein [Polaromonas sp.]|uniref:hypothetical protein n=1 Tax=Polaromonas sp. TaxID=1869339 RepID=UPI003266E78B
MNKTHNKSPLALIGYGVLLAIVTAPALALSPAIPENMVCAAPQIFVGEILATRSMDCRLKYPEGSCSPTDKVEVVVRVDRIVLSSPGPAWASKFALKEGQNADVAIWMHRRGYNKYPALLETHEKPITDEVAANLLKGKRFVFSTGGPDSVLSGIATLPTTLPWIEETLKSCRTK